MLFKFQNPCGRKNFPTRELDKKIFPYWIHVKGYSLFSDEKADICSLKYAHRIELSLSYSGENNRSSISDATSESALVFAH